ncbi:hypothetical protein B566_EDAN018790 [Ephemera danica]|nr:hypothetical protein B566_EDAN018790 [Ephemera danica]
MEHMVDTVLQFEGDRHLAYRILRTTKNRFGSTSELGIYEMIATGLRQVSNPSEILISQRDSQLSGITIGAMVEGNRPMLIEIQSLVSPATYGTPQRSSTGFDAKRLNMLLAVLEKRGGFRLGTMDVFINIAGGLRVEDPAIDLAVIVSLVSSLEGTAIANNVCFAAEVGLGGEHNTGFYFFAKLVVWHTYHRHQRYTFMLYHYFFHFTGIHIKTTPNYHVFGSVHDEIKTFLIFHSHIARV